MKTRSFIVYSFIYLLLVAAIVYVLNNSNYSINVFSYNLELPIAIWFVLPVALFAVLAALHIFYHSIGFYRYKHFIKRDTSLYNEFVKEIFLALPSNKEFRTEFHKTSSAVARILSPWGLYKDIEIDNPELDTVIKNVKSVKAGEIVDLKKYRLSKDNPLFIQNELNKIEKLKDYYLEILKRDSFNDLIDAAALKKLIECGSFADIRRYMLNSKETDYIVNVLQRYANDDINMTSDEIYEILNNQGINQEQYLKAAMILKNKLKPESYKSMFEKIKHDHQNATKAYLYVLYELVLLDELREYLQGTDSDDFADIKILLFLKENNKNISSELFFK
ncbi:uroporphyrinogen III synthase HEM4 [Campylobacter pinnipediorum]|uniref:uroporphyrinogen III synthase HEM4 n=1 Tax=Campylobacter pinnipediorum TaxID=1965231 RepID=UPI00084DA6F9|nr:uroporphyrinogen III synthase HEM4 [Campylobacter pinnipediorum]AQW83215.1 putative membrane protein [Campylobacter pinnipediorum subsp. pinnipediorum]